MTWRPDLLGGRVALVTGAARGIGRATAAALAAAGADVFLHARTLEAAEAACASLAASGTLRPLGFDMTDPAAIRAGFAAIQKEAKRLDILVNNAGILREALVEMASLADMDAMWETNLRGLMVASQYGARLMARAGGGAIVNIGSIMGRVGNPGQSVYAATKAGVIGFSLSLAKELGPKRIRVNVVAPGVIETDLIAATPEAVRTTLLGRVPLGRFGTPEDVADCIVFLASDHAAYVTGQVIGVDGGLVV